MLISGLQVTSPLELTLLAEKDYFKLLVRSAHIQYSTVQLSTAQPELMLSAHQPASNDWQRLALGLLAAALYLQPPWVAC